MRWQVLGKQFYIAVSVDQELLGQLDIIYLRQVELMLGKNGTGPKKKKKVAYKWSEHLTELDMPSFHWIVISFKVNIIIISSVFTMLTCLYNFFCQDSRGIVSRVRASDNW